MNQNSLVSYAILAINNNVGKDYFSYFEPFVIEIIKKVGRNGISSTEVKKGIQDYFKIDIPVHVVDTIITSRLKKKGYVEIENRILYPTNKDNYLDDTAFKDKLTYYEKTFRDLITAILDSIKRKFNYEYSDNDIEESLINFIKKYNLDILKFDAEVDFRTSNSADELNYQISSVITEFLSEDSYLAKYLVDIVKGSMVLDAISNTDDLDLSKIEKKFKNTTIYVDTSLAMFLLGLSGDRQQEPRVELIKLLQTNGANLSIFERNINEIENILEYLKFNLKKGNDPHGTINWLIENDYDEVKIDLLIDSIEKKLQDEWKIRKVENVPYFTDNYEYAFDEAGLEEHLKKTIDYRKDEARETDVYNISAIHRLRRGKTYRSIEECVALFSTTNRSLVRQVNEFTTMGNKSIIGKNVDIPLIIHETTLTNLVWLKSPNKFSDLPKRKLLAHVLAAKLPNENLWDMYIKFIDEQTQHENFTDEEIIKLKYNPIAKELLMDKTYGNSDHISYGLLQEIIKEVKERDQEELRQKNEKQKEEHQMMINQRDEKVNKLQSDLDASENDKKKLKDDDCKLRSEIYKKKINKSFKVLIVINCLILAISALWTGISYFYDFKCKIFYTILAVLLTVIAFINALIRPFKDTIEEKYKNKIWKRILSESTFQDFERPDKK